MTDDNLQLPDKYRRQVDEGRLILADKSDPRFEAGGICVEHKSANTATNMLFGEIV